MTRSQSMATWAAAGGLGLLATLADAVLRAWGGGVTVLSLPCAVLTGLVLASGRGHLAPLLGGGCLGALSAFLLLEGGWAVALAATGAVAVTVAVASRAVRSPRGRPLDLTRSAELWRFAAIAAGLAPVAGALAFGSAMLVLGADPPRAADLLRQGLASTLAMTVLVPVLLLAAQPGRLPGTLRAAAEHLVLGGVTLIVFAQPTLPLVFLILPPLLYVVGRQGLAGAAVGLLTVGLISGILTLAGHGRFALVASTGEERALLLQLFLLPLAAGTLPLAALLAGRQRLAVVLRSSRERSHRRRALLGAALASMEQGLIAFDADQRLLAANGRYTEMLRLPAALSVPGTHFLEIARHLAMRGDLGPGDPDVLAQLRLIDAFHGSEACFLRQQPDGRVLQGARRMLPDGGTVFTFSDVTEQVLRERQLRDSESQYRLLAEHSGDVVARLGLDGTPRYLSPAVARVLAWPPEELVGQPLAAFVHADDLEWVDSTFVALAAGDTEEAAPTWRFLRPDGSHAWVEAQVRLVRDAATGQPAEVIATLRDATDRKAAEGELLAAFEQMQNAALSDGLTGLANRRRFDEVLAREWRRAVRDGLPLSVLLVDADRFKLYNDRYGHSAGDECLRTIAAAMTAAARRAGDLAARYGGEEFAVVLPATDGAGAAEVAEHVRALVMEAGVAHAGNLPSRVVTVSVGVATLLPALDPPPTTDDLLRAADAALYEAKGAGRNRVMTFTAALAQAA